MGRERKPTLGRVFQYFLQKLLRLMNINNNIFNDLTVAERDFFH